MEPSCNDDVSLESTVLMALMRLQNVKSSCKKQRSCNGVSCESIVKYLNNNNSWLDGDIESQVMTTILSCVKTGLICALDCGKFRLIEPKSKNMVTSCVTRISHGSNCTCLKMLRSMKTFRRPCCVLKEGSLTLNRGRKMGRKKSGKKLKLSRWGNCALKAQEEFGSTSTVFKPNGKCNYCLEFHSPPKPPKNACTNCNFLQVIDCVPQDKFSPRDEVISDNWQFFKIGNR